MNNITEPHFIPSTDCKHVVSANLLLEIITVRHSVLSLPTWFSRDLIDDVLSSVCVYCWLFIAFTVCLTVCLSIMYFVYDFIIYK